MICTLRVINYFWLMFGKMCLKIHYLDPVKFLSAPALGWKGALKKTEVKLELLTDIYMLLIVEKSIRGGMCLLINQYEKADKKYCKDIGIWIIYMLAQCCKSSK